MDISSDKLAKSHMRNSGPDYESETLREKVNPSRYQRRAIS